MIGVLDHTCPHTGFCQQIHPENVEMNKMFLDTRLKRQSRARCLLVTQASKDTE